MHMKHKQKNKSKLTDPTFACHEKKNYFRPQSESSDHNGIKTGKQHHENDKKNNRMDLPHLSVGDRVIGKRKKTKHHSRLFV